MPNPNLPFRSGPRNLLQFYGVQDAKRPSLPLEDLFVGFLFVQSAKRRVTKNHDGLLLEAAHKLIELVLGSLEKTWETEGFNLSPANDWRDDFAENIVKVYIDNLGVRKMVDAWIYSHRAEIFGDAHYTLGDPQIFIHIARPPESIKTKMIELIDEAQFEDAMTEGPIETFNRTLDYIEHRKGDKDYKLLFALKRALTNLVRVHNCFNRLGV